MKQEIDEKIGAKTKLAYDDLNRLDYIDFVIKESLRLYPPFVSINRIIDEDTQIMGYEIPKNTEISVL